MGYYKILLYQSQTGVPGVVLQECSVQVKCLY